MSETDKRLLWALNKWYDAAENDPRALQIFKETLSAQGLAIVPLEPTEEMLKAACETKGIKAIDNMVVFAHVHGIKLPEEEEPPVIQAYKAMLAASE